MKKLFTRGMVSLCTMTMIFCMLPASSQANIVFTQPETMLVEGSQEGSAQWGVDIGFDNANTLHSVWIDTRFGPLNPWIYGTWLNDTGFVHLPYRGYHGSDSYDYDLPFVTRNSFDSSHMYVFGLENDGSATLNGVVSEWDLTQLPGEPGVSDFSQIDLIPGIISTRDGIDLLSCGDYLIYVYEFSPSLYLRRYNANSNSWDTSEVVLTPPVDNEYRNPSLAKDDDGFVYLSYDLHSIPGGTYNLVVRRSNLPNAIDDFQIEHFIGLSSNTYFNADLAVAGPAGAEYCSLTYVDPNMSSVEIVCNSAYSSDWALDLWGGGIYSMAIRAMGTFVLGPNAAYDADGQTLYAAWADNSSLFTEIYSAVSYDNGVSFQSDQQLTSNAMAIVDGPCIATGTDPGVVAIAYTRNSGSSTSPFVLYSIPEFFDKCDADPSTYWDSYGGVSLHYTGTVMPVSPPACYRLATASARGQLLNDYGSVEHTGSVTLEFYDDDTITGSGDDFYVALENNNLRGVIRMLGVRNDTTQNNYAYSIDGTNWLDMGVPRSTGWHQLSMVTDTTNGLTMYIDNPSTAVTDPSFTTFTTISMEGGTDTDPYYVDNIMVSTLAQVENLPIPVTSPLSLTLLLGAMGYAVLRRKRC